MDDAVLVTVGGAARLLLSEHPTSRMRVVSVDPDGIDRKDLRVWNAAELANMIEGARVVVVFSMLGGHTSDDVLPDVLSTVSAGGCRTVAVLGLPYRFEDDRRSRAEEAIRRLAGSAERTILVDADSLLMSGAPDQDFMSVLMMKSHRTAFALDCALQLLDGPFFSTLSQQVYTFAYVNTMMISDAVGAALRTVSFPTTPTIGKLVVAVGSNCSTVEINQVRAAAAFRTGIVPDVFKRDDLDLNRVVVFVPVQIGTTGLRVCSFCY